MQSPIDGTREASVRPAERDAAVEMRTQQLGIQLLQKLSDNKPGIFDRRWWDDRALALTTADEAVKVQAFRFVDVLPTLRSDEAVTRHLQEYFGQVHRRLPTPLRLAVDIPRPEGWTGRLTASAARTAALRMARRFIAGRDPREVLRTVSELRQQGMAFTLDLLGEATTSEREAHAYQQAYLDLLSDLAPEVTQWPLDERIDRDSHGPIPRLNVSLKLSALYSRFKPIDPEGSFEGVAARVRPLLRKARELGAYVHVDMEHYAYKDLTLDIFKQILCEDEFRDISDVGIVIQAYLRDAQRDLERLLEWVQQRGTPVWVRLVKGAYWDYETVHAASQGWPVPVYQQKWESDASFERCTRFLMEHHRSLRPALGSHNLRSLAAGIAWAEAFDVPQRDWEIQVLYGMGAEQAKLFADMGYRVRVYTPFGDLIPGMAYLVRRLLENTSNESFLRRAGANDVPAEELMMNPVKTGSRTMPRDVTADKPVPEFTNEPLTDFSRAENREAMQHALERVVGSDQLYPLIIGGEEVRTDSWIDSRNPGRTIHLVGRAAAASPEDALRAIAAARDAFPLWSRTDVHRRADYLISAAAAMRRRRFELAAWMVCECAKPWAEADGDVAEAIDFCVYYADQMRRLAEPRRADVPGEENAYFYRPRGVAVVIAPWNFPLAILTGMTAAALVTGNTVVMKPAEQSSVIAAKLMEIFHHELGLPAGVVNYLSGDGEVVGPALVESPDVDLIAFTGSREVGLSINLAAADTDPRQRMVKHVIAEMGGKNAIIVDEDADLDEAVTGVVQSAFGYAGQKCSACSRAIVLASAYEAFVARLVEATRSIRVGPAEHPGTAVNPLIDADAARRVREYIEIGKREGRLAIGVDVGELAAEGHYVGPHVFTDVPPDGRLAQEEVFGPVLAVLRAADFDAALRIANGTRYALTGGVYSRSPRNLDRARREFEVGNLYLNRPITGAMVHRQPFGGYRMSGIGTKAGGPDYLLQFLIPVAVTENTLRRGFAPPQKKLETSG